jgi:hypothetical protein
VKGRTIQVQWFERDRLEIQADGTITAGRLGARFLELQGRPWQRGTDMPYNSDCTFVAETARNMCGMFRHQGKAAVAGQARRRASRQGCVHRCPLPVACRCAALTPPWRTPTHLWPGGARAEPPPGR